MITAIFILMTASMVYLGYKKGYEDAMIDFVEAVVEEETDREEENNEAAAELIEKELEKEKMPYKSVE